MGISVENAEKRFGDFQLVELTGTIGYYCMLAMTANGGSPGWCRASARSAARST